MYEFRKMFDVGSFLHTANVCASNKIPATLSLVCPLLLNQIHYLPDALIAVSSEKVVARTLRPSRKPKGKIFRFVGLTYVGTIM